MTQYAGDPSEAAEVHQPIRRERVMDRSNDGIEVRQQPDTRRAAQEAQQDSVVALVDQSRLRRECLKIALTEHESAWRILDLASAEDVLRLAEGGRSSTSCCWARPPRSWSTSSRSRCCTRRSRRRRSWW